MQDVAVLLPPITTSYYSSSLEPQMLTHRTANIGYVYVDSQDPWAVQSPVNMVVSDQISPNDPYPGVLAQNVRRLSINQAGLNWVSPNILDGFNNQIVFTVGPNTFSIELDEGFYTAAQLVVAMKAKMDVVTAGIATTWTFALIDPVAPLSTYAITNNNAFPFNFVETCIAIVNGQQTLGLSNIQTQLATQYMQPSMWYTRYVDFCSARLTQHCKMPSRSTNKSSNILARFWLAGLIDPTTKNQMVVSEITPTGINWDFGDAISSFDIQVLDEYGNLLNLGQDVIGNGNNFAWSLNIRLEF